MVRALKINKVKTVEVFNKAFAGFEHKKLTL